MALDFSCASESAPVSLRLAMSLAHAMGVSTPSVLNGHLHSDADPLYADRIRVHYQTCSLLCRAPNAEILSAAFALMI